MTAQLPRLHEPHDHRLQIYDDDSELVDEVARYLSRGLDAGETLVTFATAEHRAAVLAQLDAGQREDATAAGRLLCFDAEETLQLFAVGGAIDRDAFDRVLGAALTEASSHGRPVRVFGEMVALLWDRGDVTAALALEDLWNELADEHAFGLHCAYPSAALNEPQHLAHVHRICRQHTALRAPDRYSPALPRHGNDAGTLGMLLPITSAAGLARRLVEQALAGLAGDVIEKARLVTSELVTNAVLHAGTPMFVTVQRPERRIRLEVRDLSPAMPRPTEPHDGGGCGLQIIGLLSGSWGVEQHTTGKTVWAELDLS